MGVSAKIYLLPGFWSEGVVSYLFGQWGIKMLGVQFWILAHGPRKLQGWSTQQQNFWNLDFFHEGTFYFFIQFCQGMHPECCRGSSRWLRVKNQDLEFCLFVLKLTCSRLRCNTFCFYALFHTRQPRCPKASAKCCKIKVNSSLQYEKFLNLAFLH